MWWTLLARVVGSLILLRQMAGLAGKPDDIPSFWRWLTENWAPSLSADSAVTAALLSVGLILLLAPSPRGVGAVLGRLTQWLRGNGVEDEATEGGDDLAVEGTDIHAERGHVEPLRFDGHSLIADIVKPDLMHISESYVDFEINIRNLSGRRVKIEGFAGVARIAGLECALPPSLPRARGWMEPESREGGLTHVLRQPITPDIAQHIGGPFGGLRGEGWIKRIDLSSVRLVGVYEEEGETRPLPDDCWLYGVTFVLKGPVKDGADAEAIHRTPVTFVSQRRYDSDGVRKQATEPEPPIEPGSEITSDGVLWVWDGELARAQCPLHPDTNLLYRANGYGATTGPPADRSSLSESHEGGHLICPEHAAERISLGEPETYGEARHRAENAMRARFHDLSPQSASDT